MVEIDCNLHPALRMVHIHGKIAEEHGCYMTKSDFNIFVLGLVLIAVAIASYAAKVSEVLREVKQVKTPSHFERYSYTTNIIPELTPKAHNPKILVVVFRQNRSYSYCKDTTCNRLP